MTPGKRILVTGGAGFIGSHVADGFLGRGHTVAVVDDLSVGRREHVDPRANFYPVDITDADAVAEVFARERPQIVDHHAAQASVIRSMQDPVYDARVNILGSVNLLEAAREHGVERFIFASTGGALYGEPEYLPCDEDHSVRPLSAYGAAKYAVETYLLVYRQTYGLPFTLLRYANVYGPRQDPYGEAGVVAIFSQRMNQGLDPIIYGTGEQERDFVYVGDVVEANLRALEAPPSGVYNIGTGQGVSVNRIAALLADIIQYRGQPVYQAERPGEVFRISLDSARAQTELGWTPRTSLEEGLTLTVRHLQTVHPS